MRLLLAAAAAGLLLAPTAQAAPAPVGRARDHITNLNVAENTSWNWREGDRRGSSIVAQGSDDEVVGPPGLISAPTGFLGNTDFVAAYSHGGRLSTVVDGKRITAATHRHGVGNERYRNSGYELVLGWVEKHRRLYAAVSRTRTYDRDRGPVIRRPFTRPQLLSKGRIRAMALDARGSGSVVVWQDGRDRIRASVLPRRGRFFGPAFTVAKANGKVDDLRLDTNGYRQSFGVTVAWTTPRGVFQAVKGPLAKRFGKTTVLSRAKPSGLQLETIEGGYRAWGEPGRVRIVLPCPDGLHERTIPTDGTPHVDDLSRGGSVSYTLAGTVFFEREPLGPGRDSLIPSDELVWIDGGQVVRATPQTPGRPAGEGAPEPCETI